MAIFMNEAQEQFFTQWQKTEKKTRTKYTNKFKEAGNLYFSRSEVIKIKEMTDSWVYADITIRGTEIKMTDKNGVNVIELTPPQISKSDSFTADEINYLDSKTAIESNTMVDRLTEVRNSKIETLKAGYVNSLELISQEIFINGVYTTADGQEFNMGLHAPVAIAVDTAEDKALWLVEQVEAYETNEGYFPKVMAGKDLVSALLKESRLTTNSKLMDGAGIRLMSNDGRNNSYTFLINGFQIEVEKFPIARKANGDVIDTSDMVTLYNPETLGMAYAGIKILDDAGTPHVLTGEVVIDTERGKKSSGVNAMFCKGHPLPVIVNIDLFRRYTITIS